METHNVNEQFSGQFEPNVKVQIGQEKELETKVQEKQNTSFEHIQQSFKEPTWIGDITCLQRENRSMKAPVIKPKVNHAEQFKRRYGSSLISHNTSGVQRISKDYLGQRLEDYAEAHAKAKAALKTNWNGAF